MESETPPKCLKTPSQGREAGSWFGAAPGAVDGAVTAPPSAPVARSPGSGAGAPPLPPLSRGVGSGLGVPSCVGPPGFGDGSGVSCTSNAPMSQCAPCGRVMPR